MVVSRWNEVLRDNGHENFNVCPPRCSLSQDLKARGFPVMEWNNIRYFSPGFSLKLRKYIIEKQMDIILLQNLRDLWVVSPALYGLKNVKLMGFSQIHTVVKKTDILHRWIYKPLKYLFTLTDWQQEAIKPYLPVSEEKYRTVPNSVDTSLFNPRHRSIEFRKSLGFKPDDFLIGIVGSIDPQKGQYELIRAFSPLALKDPKIHLLICGGGTGKEKQIYYKKLTDQVSQSGLGSRIHFQDFRKDIHILFPNLDLFVLPSYCETFGYVVIEAMASGTPVLATNSGGVPEILEHGQLGNLFQPKSIPDLKEKLEKLLSNPEEQKEKSLKAIEKARHFYDHQKVYERFMEIISH